MIASGMIDSPLQQAVYQLLMNDEFIVGELASNKPWAMTSLPASVVASFVPVDKGPLLNTPYMTYQNTGMSPLNRVVSGAFFIIRCYNSSEEDYLRLNSILSRVKTLLDHHSFELEGFSVLQLECVNTGSELVDQAYHQNFREMTFQISYL